MQYVKRRLSTVEAVKFTGAIDESVCSILENKVGLYYFARNSNDLYIYNELNKPHLVKEGEMIVLYNNGLLGVLAEEDFNTYYKEFSDENAKVDLAVSPEFGGLLLN